MKKVLYIGWIGYKNLGDELMFDLFKEQFTSFIKNGQLDFVNCEKRFLDNVNFRDYDLVVLGGGSIMNGPRIILSPLIIDLLYDAVQDDVKVMIWGTGMDWLEKDAIQLLEDGEEIAEIVLHPLIEEKSKVVFSKSVWTGVRGPLTFEILKRLGLTEHAHISGDSGFLLQPSPLKKPKNDEQPIIGVNWGTSFNNVYGENEEKVEDQLAEAIQQLIDIGYRIHLFTVWDADIAPTKNLYDKINKPEAVVMDTTQYNHESLMDVLKEFRLTINFKLHANYLSLASNVPFIALGYRFKIYDFVKSVDLQELLIDMDADSITEEVLALEKYINEEYEVLVKKMETYKNMYRTKLMVPFVKKLFLEE